MQSMRRRPVVTDVPWSVCVCLSAGHIGGPCKTAKSIEMPFGVWTRGDPWKHSLDGAQISPREVALLADIHGKARLVCGQYIWYTQRAAMRPLAATTTAICCPWSSSCSWDCGVPALTRQRWRGFFATILWWNKAVYYRHSGPVLNKSTYTPCRRDLDRFIRFCRADGRDQQTHRPRHSVCSNRPHLLELRLGPELCGRTKSHAELNTANIRWRWSVGQSRSWQ